MTTVPLTTFNLKCLTQGSSGGTLSVVRVLQITYKSVCGTNYYMNKDIIII